MIPALSLQQLEKQVKERYDFGDRRIVGIVLARYGISVVKKVIGESYYYWNHNSGREFDIYWLGYGEYLSEDMESSSRKILMFDENSTRVYFDTDAFISVKNKINSLPKVKYKDKFELLLVNYYDGELHYDENITIDLEKNIDENLTDIRELMELITSECKLLSDVKQLYKKIRKREVLKAIKGITVSEFITKVAEINSFL